ncbi:MAG: SCP2 sterol-binding domain-containing protein [Nitrososphaerota archaeon]|jgi:putative sterol carrier protein|nr:SCP2 sterol-binding domain-containing protein [Nitrososphaerota archaeon]
MLGKSMETKTVQEFFESALASRFKPEKAKNIQVTVQVNLTGNNHSDWIITIKDQKIHVVQGIAEEPTLTFKASENVFLDLVNGKIGIENAFFSGKINFKGDITTALKLKETGFL